MKWIGLASLLSVFLSGQVFAKQKDLAFVPFFFQTESLGKSFGVAGVAKGVGQPQAALFGMGLYTDKDSYVGFLSAFNYALSDSVTSSVQLYQGQLNQTKYYVGNQGNNDSSPDDFTFTDGTENRYKLEFRFFLPWGEIAQQGLKGAFIPQRDVRRASPLESGISSIYVKPFYSSRTLESDGVRNEASGVELIADWDNRDSNSRPTRGSHSQFTTTIGADNWSNDDKWVKLEAETSHYFSLGELGDWFDQQIIALNAYTADTPSWQECQAGQRESRCGRPAEHEQVRLGGLYRLRSYSGSRFHGRSAVHYAAEYRVIPDWQPLGEIPVINYYDLPWWQWVVFAEAGRVADSYNLKELHTDLKWSLGGAIRFQVEGIVVRTEIAQSEDDRAFRVMINQPF
ncbi:BamA/TamA family outer membrane protein [Vibrio sp. WXL103]|uniref:BamA/TamA family outer membrane protein n=1 Tax=unclassified Vibrio TaxID=2614977 RepID=UPI003EC89A84